MVGWPMAPGRQQISTVWANWCISSSRAVDHIQVPHAEGEGSYLFFSLVVHGHIRRVSSVFMFYDDTWYITHFSGLHIMFTGIVFVPPFNSSRTCSTLFSDTLANLAVVDGHCKRRWVRVTRLSQIPNGLISGWQTIVVSPLMRQTQWNKPTDLGMTLQPIYRNIGDSMDSAFFGLPLNMMSRCLYDTVRIKNHHIDCV